MPPASPLGNYGMSFMDTPEYALLNNNRENSQDGNLSHLKAADL